MSWLPSFALDFAGGRSGGCFDGTALEQLAECSGIDDRDAELLRLRQLGACTRAGNEEVRLLRHRAARLATGGTDGRLGLLPAVALDRAGHDHDLCSERA